jgi:hypothetical protein
MRVKPKLRWRLQDVEDARNVTWGLQITRPQGQRYPIPHSSQHATICPGCQTWSYEILMFALLHFGLALVPFLLFMSPLLPFWMGMITVSHWVLETCDFVFYFTGTHRWESTLGPSSVRTLGTLGDGLIAFCIVRWPWTFGGQKQNVIACMWNVPHRRMCWTLGPQLVALFWEVLETLGDGV